MSTPSGPDQQDQRRKSKSGRKVKTKRSSKKSKRGSTKSKRGSKKSSREELPLQDLEKLPYYHGLLTREDIEGLLEGDDKDGRFVIRLTQLNNRKNICISVRWKKENRHYIAYTTGKAPQLEYHIEKDQNFTSIQELVEFYMKNKKPINDPQGPKLVTPLPRQTWELAHDQITFLEKLGEGKTELLPFHQ